MNGQDSFKTHLVSVLLATGILSVPAGWLVAASDATVRKEQEGLSLEQLQAVLRRDEFTTGESIVFMALTALGLVVAAEMLGLLLRRVLTIITTRGGDPEKS